MKTLKDWLQLIRKYLRAGRAGIERWNLFGDAPDTTRQSLVRKLVESKCIQNPACSHQRAEYAVQKIKENEQNHILP